MKRRAFFRALPAAPRALAETAKEIAEPAPVAVVRNLKSGVDVKRFILQIAARCGFRIDNR